MNAFLFRNKPTGKTPRTRLSLSSAFNDRETIRVVYTIGTFAPLPARDLEILHVNVRIRREIYLHRPLRFQSAEFRQTIRQQVAFQVRIEDDGKVPAVR